MDVEVQPRMAAARHLGWPQPRCPFITEGTLWNADWRRALQVSRSLVRSVQGKTNSLEMGREI